MKHRFLSKKYWNNFDTKMGKSNEYLKKYDDIINFSLGDPDIRTDYKVIKLAFEDALKGYTHYSDSYGDIELRKEICEYYEKEYNQKIKVEECMITTSGCHAMWLVLEAILDIDDEVIIHAPYFPPYPKQIKLARGKPIILETYEKDNFQINKKNLEHLITENTKAIIVNSPNNPTGACFSKNVMNDIAKIAQKYDLIVIADDIYTKFSFEKPFIPIMTLKNMQERTITINSFSKDYAMTGWRIGNVIAPNFIIKALKAINENNVFTAPSISQRAALYALRNRHEIQPPMIKEYKKRIDYAYEKVLETPKMSSLPPRGGMYLFVNIKKTGLSSEKVVERILNEAHVLVLPGNTFGNCGEGYIRFAMTVDIKKIKKAFNRIQKMVLFQQ